MKLIDIKVGREYGVVQNGKDSYGSEIPRRVKVVRMTTEVEPCHHYDRVKEVWVSVAVKRFVVKFLDVPNKSASHYNKVATAKKGSTMTVERLAFKAPWSELGAGVAAKHAKQQEVADLQASYNKRLRALGFRGMTLAIDVDQTGSPSIRNWGHAGLDKLLALAEKGKAAS